MESSKKTKKRAEHNLSMRQFCSADVCEKRRATILRGQLTCYSSNFRAPAITLSLVEQLPSSNTCALSTAALQYTQKRRQRETFSRTHARLPSAEAERGRVSQSVDHRFPPFLHTIPASQDMDNLVTQDEPRQVSNSGQSVGRRKCDDDGGG